MATNPPSHNPTSLPERKMSPQPPSRSTSTRTSMSTRRCSSLSQSRGRFRSSASSLTSPSPSHMTPYPPPPSIDSPPSPQMNVVYARGGNEPGTGIEQGPGPLRHPRPLTPAELYWQLEREQEAVVNRLTRELSQLRAYQSASVASSASSSVSAGIQDQSDPVGSGTHLTGATHPLPLASRTRRSSSGTSTQNRSVIVPGSATSIGYGLGSYHTTTPSQASIERAREGGVMSRQNSITSARSRASSPAHPPANFSNFELVPAVVALGGQQHRQPLPTPHHPHLYQHHHVPHQSSPHFHGNLPIMPGMPSATSPTSTTVFHLPRVEEAARYRADMEAAKVENDALKRRVRDLERALSGSRRKALSGETTAVTATTNIGVSRSPSSSSSLVAGPPGYHDGGVVSSTSVKDADHGDEGEVKKENQNVGTGDGIFSERE